MKKFIKTFVTIFFSTFILVNVCSQELRSKNDFSAYYTKIKSGAEWEIYDRTGSYPDIIVNLGALNGKFIFWRGASYLPYWINDNGNKFYVEEIIERNGDGSDIMPDRVNTYSHVKIISIRMNL